MKRKNNTRKPWFSESCRDLHNTVKSYEKFFNKCPTNETYRSAFYKFRSKLRRCCKREIKNYKQQIYSELSKNMEKDPKTFWNLVKKLDGKPYKSDDEYTGNDKFLDFYKQEAQRATVAHLSTKNTRKILEWNQK